MKRNKAPITLSTDDTDLKNLWVCKQVAWDLVANGWCYSDEMGGAWQWEGSGQKTTYRDNWRRVPLTKGLGYRKSHQDNVGASYIKANCQVDWSNKKSFFSEEDQSAPWVWQQWPEGEMMNDIILWQEPWGRLGKVKYQRLEVMWCVCVFCIHW